MESESFRYRKAKRHERDLLEQICTIALEGTEPHVFVDLLESIQNYELRKRLLSTEKHKNQEYAIMYAVRGAILKY